MMRADWSDNLDADGEHWVFDDPRWGDLYERYLATPSRPIVRNVVAEMEQEVTRPQGGSGKKPAMRNRYAAKCQKCGGWIEAEQGSLLKTANGWKVEHIGDCPPKMAGPVSAKSTADTGLNLIGLPEGRYAVPSGTTRLKVQVSAPTTGKWAGWIFISDGAEYGAQKKYGRQKPGETYAGGIFLELVEILSDPAAASAAYGRLTSNCGVCGRHLEDAESIERGIGPVCAIKKGW